MIRKIKSITKTSDERHPAVGFTYNVEFSDSSVKKVTDDEFLEAFEDYRKPKADVQSLVGRKIAIE